MAVERVPYGGWQNCYRVSNGIVELIATSDVGPRLIRFGFVGGENEFAEIPEQMGLTGGDVRRNYGGHRLWHAPEIKERTYYPDNEPVQGEILSDFSLKLTPPIEKTTGIQKSILVEMSPDSAYVKVTHFLTNKNLWAIELAPWALTMMAKGGRAIVPMPPYIPHPEKVLPACPLILWHYTDMSDPRWHWGKRYIVLSQDPNATLPKKLESVIYTVGLHMSTETEFSSNTTNMLKEQLIPTLEVQPNSSLTQSLWKLRRSDH